MYSRVKMKFEDHFSRFFLSSSNLRSPESEKMDEYFNELTQLELLARER